MQRYLTLYRRVSYHPVNLAVLIQMFFTHHTGLSMKTNHKILFQDARDLKEIPSESVDLVVTSPPYPMIDMWDDMFSNQNIEIERRVSGW